MIEKKKISKDRLLCIALIFIVALGALLRLVGLDSLPDGVLPDEAYAAYNSYALMTEGIDSRGYHNPVYFVAWGSGMSVLYSYIAIPFMQVFGVTIWAFRLPQALFGIACIYAMYVIGKEFYSKELGVLLAFFLCINPWHIMNTRFALDANMAPSMFVISFAFLALALKRKVYRYYILSAVFAGATLYCYAQSWIMIPIFLVLCLFYYRKSLPSVGKLIGVAGVLFVIALPLLLFVAINIGLLDEIQTSFISIPKLASFRGDELSIGNLITSLKDTIRVILTQSDGATHTYSALVGAYYTILTPFILLGIILQIKGFICDCKAHETKLEYMMLLWLLSAGVICILNQNVTIIHINLIHIPIIFYSAYGLWQVGVFCHNRYVIPITALFLSVSCALFMTAYATEFDSHFFDERADEVVNAAKELAGETEDIYFVGYTILKYSNLLWMELPSPSTYYEEVVYTGDAGWQEMESFGAFHFIESSEDATAEGIYILLYSDRELFMELGYEVLEVNDRYALAYQAE